MWRAKVFLRLERRHILGRGLYFRNKTRAGAWVSAPVLAAWVVLLNIVVKRCTSSDVESKSLFKAGAKHVPGRENSKSQRCDDRMTFS